MKAIKSFILCSFFFLLPNLGHAYLNEHTSNMVKMKRASNYKQVLIKEDVDSDGVIRKVSWNGPHHPELKTLLGPCYSYYKDYLKQNNHLRFRGAISIDRDACHITMGGHMRSVRGEASIDK